MLDADNPNESTEPTPESTAPETGTPPEAAAAEGTAAPAKKTAAKRTTKKAAAKKTTAKKTTAKRTTRKAAAPETAPEAPVESAVSEPAAESAGAGAGTTDVAGEASGETPAGAEAADQAPPAKRTAKKTTKKAAAKRTTKKAAAAAETTPETEAAPADETLTGFPSTEEPAAQAPAKAGPPPVAVPLFQPPDPTKAVVTTRRRGTKKAAAVPVEGGEVTEVTEAPEGARTAETAGATGQKPAKKAAKRTTKKAAEPEQPAEAAEEAAPAETPEDREEEQGGERRRRRRGGRRRRRSGGGDEAETESTESEERGAQAAEPEEARSDEGEGAGGTRRRRRRRRSGEGDGDEGETTSSRARKPRNAEDEITALSGSTRLEAKKQRRREGREAGRRRAPIVSEAEFLARRESVDRVMVIRQRQDLTQIAVLEDKVLVEHYVARESQTSLIGNVYLGRVQNVLPSMEAAFIDIGKGRNAVLYAGEVNWEALGAKNGQPRKIEQVLKSGQPILVQVTKDPIGHKGARLTSQVSLPGRFLVYVPDGTTSGISRKLPDTERNRLKTLLKEIVPESAGVIVRTAAEGASEDELTRDVERLTARWTDIEAKVKTGNAPQLLYGEPDLTLKVVRDLFTEDFKKLVVAGDDAWDMVEGYVDHVAPDLADRLEKYDGDRDVFAEYRIDEQIEKALDRKVWLPSGGSLVIDRTEAMTVVDVNTGKFTGSGGNLEETVTKNNLEAAEEIVRQLRLRDIGGIIVVDFIDMVLESNRDLVLRRLVECLGRDRTRHQVAEVTSLGLVQMTRKRIGTGLLEAFSESCEHCQGRGLILHHEPVEPKKKGEDDSRRGRRGRGRGKEESGGGGVPSPKDVAAMARHEEAAAEAEPEAAAAEDDGGKTRQGGGAKARNAGEARTGAGSAEPAQAADAGEARTGAGSAETAEDAQAREATAEAKDTPAPAEDTGATPSGSRRGRGRGRARGKQARPEPEAAGPETAGPEAAAPEAAGPETERPAAAASRSEAPVAPAPEFEAPAADEASTGPEAAAEPAAPKVVTTVRRRARRAAGPPSSEVPAADGSAASDGAAPQAASSESSAPTAPAEASVGASSEADVDEPGDVDAIATLVEDAEVEVDAADPSPDGADGDRAEGATTPHVPVKKRGARRR